MYAYSHSLPLPLSHLCISQPVQAQAQSQSQYIQPNKNSNLTKTPLFQKQQELEALLEKGVISDDAYSQVHALLPAEAPLNGSTPIPAANNVARAPQSPPSLANLSLHNAAPSPSPAPAGGPPSYNQVPPPALPSRNNSVPPPPSKPVIAHARALYQYNATDSRDCSFERDDTILVFEYMNADWWMGRNERTGQEGIFPKTYVQALPGPPYGAEKGAGPGAMYGGSPAPAQPVYGGYPPPQQQQSPYNSSVPPMAVAEQPQQQNGEGGNGKAGAMGKKFGKKLGNAAIFGAGATIGSNIVNSIF